MARKSRRSFAAADLLHFIETDWFARDWDELGLEEEALGELQLAIMRRPKAGSVVRGTHGLRKMRFSPPNWPVGKRGALRVCYVYLEQFYLVLLVVVYRKDEQDTIPAAAKRAINKAIDRIEHELQKRFS